MNLEYIKEIALKLFLCDSPTGFSKNVNTLLIDLLKELGYEAKLTNKGNVKLLIEGKDHSKKRATSAHVDTLGLMVRSIKGDGTLAVTSVGGPSIPTLDGEYCKIMTRVGKVYSGTILCSSASVHVYEDAKSKPRDLDSMLVRIDEKLNSKEDVTKLGIDNGDYIFIDPKTTLTPSGFLKSRFIDDKGSVCAILGVLKELKEKNSVPAYDTVVYFVNQEEVGHGAATTDSDIDEFVTVDMGCIGKDLAGNEYAVSICAKDSGGPYSYELTTKLIQMAKENNLNYVVDIFPFYGSDIGAAWRSGVDCAGALIGPGVHASHGMERTHLEAIENTMKLLYLYLTTK
ncbi:MAG: M42 family metallopeptidase [Roseburia sp.]|nr:M42 family metallopeptidase [Anaeroplasma bactoclasticum]MCM1196417.1 M42 family metallopeptidase [Roseburia sp.]MCM1557059.1 M42 family metallopeptidase [Anaeroplasma bactoclasticum]